MTYSISTGARNKMLDTSPLKTLLAASFIKIYSGTPPVDADAALGGGNVLLCTISINSTGTGLNMAAAAAAGVLVKNASEIWSGVNAASGSATFYRHVTSADDGTLSTTQVRLQGSVALAGADLNLANTALVSGNTQPIDYYAVAIPAA